MALLHPEDIKATIRKKYGSLAQFERARQLPANSATDVLRGRSVGRTAEALASEMGVAVKIISRSSRSKKSILVDDIKPRKTKSHRLNEVEK